MTLAEDMANYSFQDYLDWRETVDYYGDDRFLQLIIKKVTGNNFERVDRAAREISPRVSQRWRKFSDTVARPQKHPWLLTHDAHNNRIDRLVRPHELEVMEREVFSEGLFSEKMDPWEKLVKMYLIYQNGEACIACPLVCTEGLVAVLDRYTDSPEVKQILQHCKEGINGEFAIGGQYISEIQGGSDIPANAAVARKTGDTWRIYGQKFFCSATHADYALVTAKPEGTDDIGLFVVPSWLPGDKEREIRNGYTIDRVKWKLGTCELTTSELTFEGAVAYPVGPFDRGLANVVGIVLTLSRLTVGLSAAASMARTAREIRKYSEFREVFSSRMIDLPMVAGQVKTIERFAQRTTAGAFEIYRTFLSLQGGLKGGLVTDEEETMKKRRFQIREMIMLQKLVAAADCTDMVRLGMSLLGGHGVMEDFSVLPRLYRDSTVNELWEGPRNVLLTQIHRDLRRVKSWYSPEDFVNDLLSQTDAQKVKELATEMGFLVNELDVTGSGSKTEELCVRWDQCATDLCHAYQDQAQGFLTRE